MDSLETQLGRYLPRPSHARICVHGIAKGISVGEKEELQRQVRAKVGEVVRHDHQAPFSIDVHLDPSAQIHKVQLKREPLYLTGTYYKRSRLISQTPMFVDTQRTRVGETSVQECIANAIVRHFYAPEVECIEALAAKMDLAGAGREDVDVQALGLGRKFILTIPDPTRTPSGFQDLERAILQESKGRVGVMDLRVATAEDHRIVSETAETRRKLYVCVLEFASAVESNVMTSSLVMNDVLCKQKTPVRVVHRRPNMVRERTVYRTDVAYISPTLCVLWIEAGAGFYIKEFVHGDLGRTTPNVSQLLGTQAELLTLDYLGSREEGFQSIDVAQAQFWWPFPLDSGFFESHHNDEC